MTKNAPLYLTIANKIRKDIESHVYKEGEQLPTENDLVQKYDVSRVTARKSLDTLAAEGLIERFPGRGTFVSKHAPTTKEKQTFGVLLPTVSPCFGTQLLYCISRQLQKHEINLLYAGTEDNQYAEAAAIERIFESDIDGLIIWPAQGEFIGKEILKLILSDFPIVLLDRYIQDAKTNFISTDNYKSTQKALKYLETLGHKRFAIASRFDDHNSSIRDRLLAAQLYPSDQKNRSLDSAGILSIPKFRKDDPQQVALAQKKFLPELQSFITANPEVTAFFVTEYYPATLLYNSLHKLGYSVPDDFSIICYDSPQYYLEEVVKFTHLKQREDTLAEGAVEILVSLLENRKIDSKKLIEADLILGDTTRKINK